jgi:hypothetical protein
MPLPRVLSHCVSVPVFGPAVPPKDVVIHMTVGGAAGDGHVDVESAPGGPVVGSVPTGATRDVDVPQATVIYLHYWAEDGKPQTVVVDCVFQIS